MMKLQSHLSFASAMIGRKLGKVALSRRQVIIGATHANETWAQSCGRKKARLQAAAKDLAEKEALLKAAEVKVTSQQLDLEKKETLFLTAVNDAGSKTVLLHAAEAKATALGKDLEKKEELLKVATVGLVSKQGIVAGLRSALKELEERYARERILWDSERAKMQAEVQEARSKSLAGLREEAAAEAAEPTGITAAEGLTFEEVFAASTPAGEADAIATLRAEVETLTQKAAEEAAAVEEKVLLAQKEAVDRYKESDNFYADMAEFQEVALDSLRNLLVEDGKVEEEVVAAYTYEVCMTR